MIYPKSSKWFLSQEALDVKRLMAYMYFFHAWATALLDDYDDELEFKVTPSGVTELQIKKDYSLNDIIYPSEKPTVKNEWLYKSIIQTYSGFSTDDLYKIIKNDPPYLIAKRRKKLKNIILNNELQKHYRFLYEKSR